MITLKNECSLKAMKSIKDNSIDLVLTDPPYNIGSKKKFTKKGGKLVSTAEAWGNDFKDEWNNFEEYWAFLKPFIIEMKRVVKDTGNIVLFLDRKYTGHIVYLIEKELNLQFKNKLYFEKSNPTPSRFKRNFLSSVEEAVWFRKPNKDKKVLNTFNFGKHSEMAQVHRGAAGNLKKTLHPCEKYEWMLEPLIKALSNEGDTILDPFAGSGAVLRMARKMNRKSIGFEKSKTFYKMACQQLALSISDAFDFKHIKRIKAKLETIKPEIAVNEDYYMQTIIKMDKEYKSLKDRILNEALNKARNKQKETA